MSGTLSVQHFVAAAKLAPKGELRANTGADGPFLHVKQGELSVSVPIPGGGSTAFMKVPPGSVPESQKLAMQGFQEVLRQQFGDDIANDVLKQAKLDRSGATLTGQAVLDTVKAAQAHLRQRNLTLAQDFVPQTRGFAAVLETSVPRIDPGSVDWTTSQAIHTAIESRVRLASNDRMNALSREDVQRIATEVIRTMLLLEQAPKLADAPGRIGGAHGSGGELTLRPKPSGRVSDSNSPGAEAEGLRKHEAPRSTPSDDNARSGWVRADPLHGKAETGVSNSNGLGARAQYLRKVGKEEE